MHIKDLENYIENLLTRADPYDYFPIGLQVQGKDIITKIVTGVSASAQFLKKAGQLGADAVITHHGICGNDINLSRDDQPLLVKQRLDILATYNLNALVYHTPLDLDLVHGNNILLGQNLGLTYIEDKDGIFIFTASPHSFSLQSFIGDLWRLTGRKPVVINRQPWTSPRIAICSGKGQKLLQRAHTYGAHIYLSGEISEQTVYEAVELGMTYISAGHYATETFGVRSLGNHIEHYLALKHEFVDIFNYI